jgi:hypothetical protein
MGSTDPELPRRNVPPTAVLALLGIIGAAQDRRPMQSSGRLSGHPFPLRRL